MKKESSKKPLPMTDNEIYLSFKNAKDKKEQIIILSELNDCDAQTIREALMRQGVSPQQLPRNRRKKVAGEKKPGFTLPAPQEKATSSPAKILDGFTEFTTTKGSPAPAVPAYKIPASVCDAVTCRLHELDSFKGSVAAAVKAAEEKVKEEKERLRAIYEEIAELEDFLTMPKAQSA